MTLRVAQFATGNVGAHSLRAILDRPELELVGVHVLSPAKVGADAGPLVGRSECGVRCTGSISELIAMRADVVIHTPLPSLVHGNDPDRDLNDMCQLLAAGTSVITTVGYMYPKVHGTSVVERLNAACIEGGSVFHGTGANPGWFGDLLPLLLSSLSLRIDRIDVREISNFQHYPSPEIMFEMMGFGRTPEDFALRAARHRGWLDGLFTEAVTMVVDGLGADVERVDSSMEPWLATSDLMTASGLVAEGTVAGQRWRWDGVVDGRTLVSQETVWRMHESAAPEWPVGDWSITIHGEPKMHVSLPHRWNRDVLASTAAHAVNAIPYVCGAKPGIATFLDLPMIAGRGSVLRR